MNVFAFTAPAQTLHQDKVAHGPSNRLDRPLRYHAVAVQQGHVRRKTRRHPSAYAGFLHFDAERVMKRCERQTAARAQHESSVAGKAYRAIEHDLEWPL